MVRLSEAKLPFVIAGAHVRPLQVNSLMADALHGIKQAVDHLNELGRSTICLVNGPSFTATSQAKYEGYRLALALNELRFNPAQCVTGDFSIASGYEKTQRLLEANPSLDAIVYGDDFMAMGGIKALNEKLRRVPADVAVIGFHDYPIAEYTSPPLTTVRFDMASMGAMAAKRLVSLLTKPDDDAWFVQLPTSLVIRESSVPSSA